MLIDLSGIRLDGGTQPRAVINSPLFEEYAQAIAEGASFPPIVVFFDGTDYWLADGFHRFHAHETLGLAQIDADVRQGDRRAAVLHAVGANADHGWRRSNDDKRRAVAALLADQEWVHWSDAEIARRCRVSQPFVSKLRPEHAVTYNVIGDDQRTYRDRHGNTSTMNVEPLRAARGAVTLVGGRVPDTKPRPEIAASAEVGIGTASAATGIKSEKLARIARSGEIEGARKDGAAWVFDTAKLKDWMAGPENEPEPLVYDHDAIEGTPADTRIPMGVWPVNDPHMALAALMARALPNDLPPSQPSRRTQKEVSIYLYFERAAAARGGRAISAISAAWGFALSKIAILKAGVGR